MVKEDFPIFKEYPGLVYLDNAATTQKPLSVIQAIKEYYEKYNANIHRGIYFLTRKSTEIYEEAHEKVAKFINANPEEVIFVKNATEGLNIAAQVLSSYVNPRDNIVVTISEHHSNFLPWFKIAEKSGADVKVVSAGFEGIKEEEILENIDENTKIVAVTHASNVTGQILDLGKIAKRAEDVGAFVVVDGAQSVPHLPTDVKKMRIHALAFSGHKMLGPMGIGALWMKKELLENADPLFYGGDMVKSVGYDGGLKVEYNRLPWKFEAGTPNVAGAAGLSAAIEYLEKYGVGKALKHEREVIRDLLKFLEEEEIPCIGPKDLDRRGGLVAFSVPEKSPHAIAQFLGLKNICVRSGYHCAEPLHRAIGLKGSVRASVYIYNDKEDIEKLIEALGEII